MEKTIDGMQLGNIITEASGLLAQEYVTNVVDLQCEDARDCVFFVTPLVFRIQLNTIILDVHDKVSVKNLIKKL